MRKNLLLFALLLTACRARVQHVVTDGPHLTIKSRDAISDAIARSYTSYADEESRNHAPWGEALHFHPTKGQIGDGEPKELWGDARVFVVAYENEKKAYREIPKAEDALLVFDQLKHTFEWIAARTSQEETVWLVTLGTASGSISHGLLDEGARTMLVSLAHQGGLEATNERIPEISTEHRARIMERFSDRH